MTKSILKIGFDSGGYMAHEHTIAHMREGMSPVAFTTEQLSAAFGGADETTLLENARNKAQAALAAWTPPDHDEAFHRELQDVVSRARKHLCDH